MSVSDALALVVTDSCKLSRGCWDSNPGSPEGQPVFPAAEPSLQPAEGEISDNYFFLFSFIPKKLILNSTFVVWNKSDLRLDITYNLKKIYWKRFPENKQNETKKALPST